MSAIYEFVKERRDRCRSDTIEVAEGYEFSQYQTIRTIDLYHNSKFTSGNKDGLGREKPLYDISKFRVNVATRATDMDTNDIQVEREKPGRSQSAISSLAQEPQLDGAISFRRASK